MTHETKLAAAMSFAADRRSLWCYFSGYRIGRSNRAASMQNRQPRTSNLMRVRSLAQQCKRNCKTALNGNFAQGDCLETFAHGDGPRGMKESLMPGTPAEAGI